MIVLVLFSSCAAIILLTSSTVFLFLLDFVFVFYSFYDGKVDISVKIVNVKAEMFSENEFVVSHIFFLLCLKLSRLM